MVSLLSGWKGILNGPDLRASKEKNRIIFLHFHKAAGTTVVTAAAKSGFKFAEPNNNGNLIDVSHGHDLVYRDLGVDESIEIIKKKFDDGVDFIAMEWDFPPINVLRSLENTAIFTVIREPTARAVSNYRFDLSIGSYICEGRGFSGYIDNSTVFRSSNYYVKLLCGLPPDASVDEKHVVQAIRGLEMLDKVIVLERCNLAKELAKFGVDERYVQVENKTENIDCRPSFGVDVTDIEKDQFYNSNFADRILYEYFVKKEGS